MNPIDTEVKTDTSQQLEVAESLTGSSQQNEPHSDFNLERDQSLKKPRSMWDALRHYRLGDVELEREPSPRTLATKLGSLARTSKPL